MTGTLAISVMSSRFSTAPPSFSASINSSWLVLFEVYMISSPRPPTARESRSSAIELQSKPKPMSFMIARILGLGRAFTA
ncbi:MAG: hypothetical protein ACD_75C00648G0001 [uncultured bacterium]|nr:MAG: hypothetical protein ACD_75C00648G0001 [uncultured bacterium]